MLFSGPLDALKLQNKLTYGEKNSDNFQKQDKRTKTQIEEDKEIALLLTIFLPFAFFGICYYVISLVG